MDAWLRRIYNLQKFGVKLGLDSSRRLLSRLGSPQFPCLHIAGTNGKGSTGAMLEAIALQAGLKTGYFISPHLVKFNERFRLNGQDIGDGELRALCQEVWAAMNGEHNTFFEFACALAFLYFARHKVDLAILETGMGGRLDSTNVCRPLVSVITNIALDHTRYLGRTLAEIARDKAGIIKPGVPLVHGAAGGCRRVIEDLARAQNSPALALGRDIRLRRRGEKFYVQGPDFKLGPLSTNLPGYHQAGNAALACAVAALLARQGWPLTAECIKSGLEAVNWPGRLERVYVNNVPLWLDGAHNPAGVRVLLKNLPWLRGRGALVMILGIMADKDLNSMLKSLTRAADKVIFTQPDCARACPAAELAELAGITDKPFWIIANLEQALQAGLRQAANGGAALVTGSLFTVGQTRAILSGQAWQV
jgi:dihydrofolate synthase/folylpolyglutamate synthase